MPRHVWRVAAVLQVLLIGCNSADHPTSTASEGRVVSSQRAELGVAFQRPQPGEALLIALELESPGFAGFYVDESTGEVVVRSKTTDVAGRDSVRARVARRLRQIGSHLAGRNTRFEPAVFSFSELAEFRSAAVSALFGAGLGVNSLDADERNNALTVGVDPGSSQVPILEHLSRVGVPTEAVRFIDFSGIVEDVGYAPEAPLRTPLSPPAVDMMGGMEVRYFDGVDRYCTLGLFTESNGNPVGITNSHCSGLAFVSGGDGTVYKTGTYAFGSESDDRSYFYTCKVGFSCRGADANLISQGPYGSVTWHQHEIAWRPNLNTVQAVDDPFYTNVDPLAPRTIAAVNYPSQGETVYKSGASTGRTSGSVVQTCITIIKDLNNLLECQNRANYFRHKGDSGAPVYASAAAGLPNVNLKGLHWGADLLGGAIFSSMQMIDQDFGSSLTSLPWGWPGGGGGGGGCGGDEGGPGDPTPC